MIINRSIVTSQQYLDLIYMTGFVIEYLEQKIQQNDFENFIRNYFKISQKLHEQVGK